MRPGRAADHSPPSSAAVMEEYSYTCTHPLGHAGPVTGSLYHISSQSVLRGVKGSATSSQKILGYFSVMPTLKF